MKAVRKWSLVSSGPVDLGSNVCHLMPVGFKCKLVSSLYKMHVKQQGRRAFVVGLPAATITLHLQDLQYMDNA